MSNEYIVSQIWDERFLSLAKLISTWSKDPNTKCGCVLVRWDKTIASVGFNGFPRSVSDDKRLLDRKKKHEIVLHAEENAINFLQRKEDGLIAYCFPMIPCSHCAAVFVQNRVSMVVAPKTTRKNDCHLNFTTTRSLFKESGIILREV